MRKNYNKSDRNLHKQTRINGYNQYRYKKMSKIKKKKKNNKK